MKYLLLVLLLSSSADSFCQDLSQLHTWQTLNDSIVKRDNLFTGTVQLAGSHKPDTLRAMLLITYDNGPAIAHTKPGFVVYGSGDIMFLDDRKKPIKAPYEVWSYKIKN